MIIENTRIMLEDIIVNYEEYLPRLFSLYLYNTIKKPNGEFYGSGFYFTKTIQNKTWIKTSPSSSMARLRNANKCVYCQVGLSVKFGVGDHIVGKELDDIRWLVPCCGFCNSSKGNRDLLYWWCIMKKRNILDLKKDVLATYIRGKYLLLSMKNELGNKPTEYHISILDQLRGIEA